MKKYLRVIPALSGLLIVCSSQVSADYRMNTESKLLNDNSSLDEFNSIVSSNKQTMYLIADTNIKRSIEPVSSTIASQLKGSAVQIISVDGENAKVLTESGGTGYVSLDSLTDKKETIFNSVDETLYTTSSIDLKALPYDYSNSISTLEENISVHIVGKNDYDYWQVEQDGNIYYINHNNLTDKLTPVVVVEEKTNSFTDSSNFIGTYTGAVLTPSAGTIMGPSGKETYYNLPMSGVVSIMQSMGINAEYWVREDGVKMYGDYIMIAADLSIPGRSRGSIVQTSLGAGMVCDTGSFIYSNPYQIDIAVAW